MHEVALPDGVGPHEGCEFDLMRAGKKDVSYFCEIEPEGLEDMLREGFCLLKFKQFQYDEIAILGWIVFREGWETEAMRLKEILTDGRKGIHSEREHEIGRLLSYTEKQVEAFISHARGMGEKP
jgi:hypothetical protein